MNVLAFDTCTDACTVALRVGEELLLDHREASQQHARLLLPMIEALLASAGLRMSALDALVVGRGPGSFTGVRIGIAAAQGLALGADVGVIGISTLAAIAAGCRRENGAEEVLAVIDARMGEVYAALEREQGAGSALRAEEWVLPPEALITALGRQPGPGTVMCGSGAVTYAAVLEQSLGLSAAQNLGMRLPQARDLLSLATPALAAGEWLDPAELQPVYLRDKVASTEAERRQSSRGADQVNTSS